MTVPEIPITTTTAHAEPPHYHPTGVTVRAGYIVDERPWDPGLDEEANHRQAVLGFLDMSHWYGRWAGGRMPREMGSPDPLTIVWLHTTNPQCEVAVLPIPGRECDEEDDEEMTQ